MSEKPNTAFASLAAQLVFERKAYSQTRHEIGTAAFNELAKVDPQLHGIISDVFETAGPHAISLFMTMPRSATCPSPVELIAKGRVADVSHVLMSELTGAPINNLIL